MGVDVQCINIAHKIPTNDKVVRYKKSESVMIMMRAIKQVISECKRNRPDLIHINTSSGNGTLRDYLIEIIAKRYKIPVVVHFHCNLPDQISCSRIAGLLFEKCVSLSAANLVLNSQSLKYVESTGNKALLLPNGIDMAEKPIPHDIREHISSIVYTGRVEESKGCLEILKCAEAFPNIAFLLAGAIDESVEDQLREQKNIQLLGILPHDRIDELLTQGDIFLFPSHSEGFSVSLLEAMANGLPCLVTAVGANEDMIESSGGTIVGVNDHVQIIDAVRQMQDREVRREMSLWNQQKVADSYRLELVYADLLQIYKSVIKQEEKQNDNI